MLFYKLKQMSIDFHNTLIFFKLIMPTWAERKSVREERKDDFGTSKYSPANMWYRKERMTQNFRPKTQMSVEGHEEPLLGMNSNQDKGNEWLAGFQNC